MSGLPVSCERAVRKKRAGREHAILEMDQPMLCGFPECLLYRESRE
jgi:hypothetical protein